MPSSGIAARTEAIKESWGSTLMADSALVSFSLLIPSLFSGRAGAAADRALYNPSRESRASPWMPIVFS